MKNYSRRDFAKFMGTTFALAPALFSLTSCNTNNKLSFGISPSSKDQFLLNEGLSYDVLIKWDDTISKDLKFGFNNDYLAFTELSPSRALLWVNHEYFNSIFVSGYNDRSGKTVKSKEQVDKEMLSVGGSIIEIEKLASEKWKFIENSKYNRRLTAQTLIPFAAGVKIAGKTHALGTFAGCAGGQTPWGTTLSCEENYHSFVGDILHDGSQVSAKHQWELFYEMHPHHYGWVVEVNPKTGEGKKLTSLGRFSHESCTVVTAKDGTIVAYSGDDKADEFIYKFVSASKTSLEYGELFVADLDNNKWVSLDLNKSKILQQHFKTQQEIQIFTRKAARLVGATPCDRPEDIEIHSQTGDIFVALTNNYSRDVTNKKENNYHGSILKISHPSGDHLSEDLTSDTFVIGGKDSKISCPDNLAFDKLGNLWVTTDISGYVMNKGPYKEFKNNGLFYIPLSGKDRGIPVQVASAPNDAELTGLSFSPDYKTLFLSVQHPGEKSKSLNDLTSHWPDGGTSIPRPAVVQISGPTLDKLMTK